jgi:hypothetical protein
MPDATPFSSRVVGHRPITSTASTSAAPLLAQTQQRTGIFLSSRLRRKRAAGLPAASAPAIAGTAVKPTEMTKARQARKPASDHRTALRSTGARELRANGGA